MDWKKFIKTDFFCIAIILLVACINIFARPYFNDTKMPDTDSYIEATQLLQGVEIKTSDHNLTRILKPVPLWGMMVINKFLKIGLEQAFLIEAIIFYLALGILVYFLLKLFFGPDNKVLLALGSVLFISSYPMLRYSISMLPESGAIFLYTLAVYFIFQFYRNPSGLIFLASVFAIIFGFMYKEYSALSGTLLFLIIIFHPRLGFNEKIVYLISYIIFALILFLPWQIYIFQKFNYTYLDWYKTNISPFKWMRVYYTVKSLFAVFLLGWFLVFAGIKERLKLTREQLFFLKSLIAVSFMIFLWSATDSRLYYVIALPLTIMAILGIKYIVRKWGEIIMGTILSFILIINYLWLGIGDKLSRLLNIL